VANGEWSMVNLNPHSPFSIHHHIISCHPPMDIRNRKAYYEYNIEAKYIAGLVLTGTEIK